VKKNICIAGLLLLGMMVVSAALPASPQESPAPKGFFLQVQGGMVILMKDVLEMQKGFSLYGEAGSMIETYKFPSVPCIDISLGTHFVVGGSALRGGLGFSRISTRHDKSLALSLPHPMVGNSFRTLAVDLGKTEFTTLNIYVFSTQRILRAGMVSAWAGLAVGLSKEKFVSLNDLNIEESTPYASENVKITDIFYAEDSYTAFWIGPMIELEFGFGSHFSLILDDKLVIKNPKIASLDRKVNFLQNQIVLGVQITL